MDIGVLSIFQNYRDEQDDAATMRGEFAIALLAEELGYDSYWATEHHFFGYSMCPDNVQWLSQIAGATTRIKLGTAAVIMPWNSPYRVAAKMALFDQQSGGRALLGFGRGLSRREYASFGIPMDEARPPFRRGHRARAPRARHRRDGSERAGLHAAARHTAPAPDAHASATACSRSACRPESAVQAAVIGARLMVLAQQPWEVFRDTALRPYQDRVARAPRQRAAAARLRAARLLRRRRGASQRQGGRVREELLRDRRRALRDHRQALPGRARLRVLRQRRRDDHRRRPRHGGRDVLEREHLRHAGADRREDRAAARRPRRATSTCSPS